jgi:hypothetical protein
MIRFVITAVLLAALSQGVAGKDRQTVPVEFGADSLRQCSRPSPTGVSGFWAPAEHQLDDVEARLETFMSSEPLLASGSTLSGYYRQYTGIVRNEKLYIYGSFFLKASVARWGSEWSPAPPACDGGSSFWGIVYSLDTQAFQELELNGPG